MVSALADALGGDAGQHAASPASPGRRQQPDEEYVPAKMKPKAMLGLMGVKMD